MGLHLLPLNQNHMYTGIPLYHFLRTILNAVSWAIVFILP